MNNSEHIKFRSARLNLKNPAERDAYQLIEEAENEGISFKQLVVDAILKQKGVDVTLYATPQAQGGVSHEDMARLLEDTLAAQLEHYTDELLRQLRKRQEPSATYEDIDSETTSTLARNFAKGVVQRRKQGMDSDE